MEAASVTGPAKNLLSFCRWVRSPQAIAAGFDISISLATYARLPEDGNSSAFVQAARASQIPIHVFKERAPFDRDALKQMADLADSLNPHIVQTHNVKSNFLWRISGARPSRKWIAFQHGYTATNVKMRLYNQFDRWSLRNADRVVTVCQAFVPHLVSYGVKRNHLRVLHNSITPPEPVLDPVRGELRQQLGISSGTKVILNIGRFSKEKGQSDLLAALQLLNTPEPWKAVLVGSGPDQPRLKERLRHLGLEDRVVFAGFHERTGPFYAIADVFVLPSHSEGSSNVILEAMAARVPIAATSAGGNPELVSNGESALLVPVGDAEALARSLTRLLTEEDLRQRLSAAAYRRAQEVFSPECYRSLLTAIYYDVLGL